MGFTHPAASVAAWDLRCELACDRGDPNAKASGWLALVGLSLAIAATVTIIITSQN